MIPKNLDFNLINTDVDIDTHDTSIYIPHTSRGRKNISMRETGTINEKNNYRRNRT
jgi:hypothetical protein